MSKKTKPPAPEFENGQKVWISRWALTDGVGIKTATFVQRTWINVPTCFDLVVDGEEKARMFFGIQFHATEEEAKAAAVKCRDKRIAGLKKQIAKLEQMKF